MAHKALYRRFRPRRFEDLKGQEVVATVLKNQVSAGEPSHAYLFSGPRGTGKTSTAKILACALNCLNPKDGEPCLECENCKAALEDAIFGTRLGCCRQKANTRFTSSTKCIC